MTCVLESHTAGTTLGLGALVSRQQLRSWPLEYPLWCAVRPIQNASLHNFDLSILFGLLHLWCIFIISCISVTLFFRQCKMIARTSFHPLALNNINTVAYFTSISHHQRNRLHHATSAFHVSFIRIFLFVISLHDLTVRTPGSANQTYQRNAINNGLIVIECPAALEAILAAAKAAGGSSTKDQPVIVPEGLQVCRVRFLVFVCGVDIVLWYSLFVRMC